MDPLARRVASVADARAADDPHAASRAAPPVRVRFPTRVRARRRRPPDGAAAVGADGTCRCRRRCARARCASRSSTPPSRAVPRHRHAAPCRRRRRGDAATASRARRRGARGSLRAPAAAQVPRCAVGRCARTPARGRDPGGELDAGPPLCAVACGAPVTLPAGPRTTVRAAATPWRLDHVLLTSARPHGPPVAPAAAGCSTPGTDGRGERDGVRVARRRRRPGSCSASPTTRGWRATLRRARRWARRVPDAGLRQRLAGRSAAVATSSFALRAQSRAADQRRDLARRLPPAPRAARRCAAGARRPRRRLAPLPRLRRAPGRYAARSRPARRRRRSCSASSFALRAGAVLGPLTLPRLLARCRRRGRSRWPRGGAPASASRCSPRRRPADDPRLRHELRRAAHRRALGRRRRDLAPLAMALVRGRSSSRGGLNTATDRAAAAPRSAP